MMQVQLNLVIESEHLNIRIVCTWKGILFDNICNSVGA